MSLKQRIANILNFTGVTNLFLYFSFIIYGRHIRVVNYHDTPEEEMKNFEEQLKFYARYYTSVAMNDLEQFSFNKTWSKNKPGLIISFDDGYRNNYDFAVPLLEKYNFTGWFFIPAGLIESDISTQYAFAGRNKARFERVYKGDRILMSWGEIKALSTNHVVGCHTWSHHRMAANDDEAILSREIESPKKLLEEKTQQSIQAFCWVGGEEHTYTGAAAEKIRKAGYKFSFMTNSYPFASGQNPLKIQRTNIESSNPISLVKFQLSSLMDLFYYGKRTRVNLITQ